MSAIERKGGRLTGTRGKEEREKERGRERERKKERERKREFRNL